MSTTKEYWLLCEDYGSYEGGIGSDGCCTEYGTHVTVNGVDLPCNNYQDVGTHLKKVLEHLGYTVNLTETYNGKQF